MKKPILIAGTIIVLVSAWVASGVLTGSDDSASEDAPGRISDARMIVEARQMTAQPVTPFIIAHGHLEPDRFVMLKNETSGQVESLLVREGDEVTTGQALIQLEADDRLIRREQAELKIEEKRRQYEATRSLAERQLASRTEVDTAQVELKMAEVELAQIELEIDNTTIKAPFDGIVEELNVEIGEYLGVGQELLTLVDNTPLVVNVRVPQQNVNSLSTGQPVRVSMLDNTEAQGSIRFIASRGDQATRTFRVEIEIDNTAHLRAGTSATAYIPRQPVQAHFISGGLLTLDSSGQMGVKTIGDDGLVDFHPVNVEYSEAEGMWVSGLPANALVITSGQGFADVDQEVIVSNQQQPNQETVAPATSGGANAYID